MSEHDLNEVEASLDEVRRNVAHGEAQYNPWALQALNNADGLLADYCACSRDLDSGMTPDGPTSLSTTRSSRER